MGFCAENKKNCLPLKENIMLNAMFVGEILHQIATDMHITINENNTVKCKQEQMIVLSEILFFLN